MKILATDLGKFNSVACLLDTATKQSEFETIAHKTRLVWCNVIADIPQVASELLESGDKLRETN